MRILNVSDRERELQAEVDGLRAARISYASLFSSVDEDGAPDVSCIHQNIRGVIAERDALKQEFQTYRNDMRREMTSLEKERDANADQRDVYWHGLDFVATAYKKERDTLHCTVGEALDLINYLNITAERHVDEDYVKGVIKRLHSVTLKEQTK